MSKLYVFGIGGTGARVLRSLTMLLASGVDCKMEISPIIIDPDSSADSLTRAVASFDAYIKVRQQLSYATTSEHFFGTKINEDVNRFFIPLQQTDNKKFEDYISLTTMSENNQALMRMLFSNDNLSSNMNVGFKGNPNIGSIVLNQFVNSSVFQQFANSFNQGDRIFIVSSIFGGTGASGFPLLLKTLRGNKTLPKFNLLNTSPIGAITVLPYFSVAVDESSAIDSSSFIDKTKAALAYYDTNITGTNSIDQLYYIADTQTPTYENSEGGDSQNNSAHVVELFSALSIIDFANMQNPQTGRTVCKEYGINQTTDTITFSDLGKVTYNQIAKPLTPFLLFDKYLRHERSSQYKHQPWAIDPEFDKSFFGNGFEKDVENILELYVNWLQELNDNMRAFSPFDLDKKRNVLKMVKNIADKKSRLSNYALFDATLNREKRPTGISKEQWFVELFYNSTKQITNNNLNF